MGLSSNQTALGNGVEPNPPKLRKKFKLHQITLDISEIKAVASENFLLTEDPCRYPTFLPISPRACSRPSFTSQPATPSTPQRSRAVAS